MAREHIKTDDLALLEAIPAQVTDVRTRAERLADPSELPRRQQQTLEQMYPPHLRKLLPPSERETIFFQIAQDYRDELETGPLYALGDFVDGQKGEQARQAIDRVIDAARRPPSALRIWSESHGTSSPSTLERSLITLIDLERARDIAAELRTAPPSQVLARYVLDGDDDTGTVRRWIETQHGAGWRGISSEDPKEAEAVLALRTAIETEQAGRVPLAVGPAKSALQQAATTLRRLKTIRNLTPRRPTALV